MSRHVVGVRAGRRNLAIVVGCGQPLGGHCGIVAGVNDVVDHAGIVGISGEQRSQDRHCFAFRGQASVVGRSRRQQR